MRRTVLPGGAAGVPPPLLRVREQRSGGETMLDAAERRALVRALEIAADPAVPLGPNPRVGCVLLSPSGEVLAEGRHRGAGTAHAEADALARASAPPAGARTPSPPAASPASRRPGSTSSWTCPRSSARPRRR